MALVVDNHLQRAKQSNKVLNILRLGTNIFGRAVLVGLQVVHTCAQGGQICAGLWRAAPVRRSGVQLSYRFGACSGIGFTDVDRARRRFCRVCGYRLGV